MIPTSIDGTDITGATIDGTDVQEITVDGDTVFSAETLPVAYSNLIAWYPFDSSFYGGSDADDVTAVFNSGQSGDSTAYDGTVNGATYQSSSGVTDINAGANSGAFDFDGSDDFISLGNNFLETSHTKMCWFDSDTNTVETAILGARAGGNDKYTHIQIDTVSNSSITYRFDDGNVSFDNIVTTSRSAGLTHVAITYDASTSSNNCSLVVNGTSVGTASKSAGLQMLGDVPEFIGDAQAGQRVLDGIIDDVRFYNIALSESQINQIYQNTKP